MTRRLALPLALLAVASVVPARSEVLLLENFAGGDGGFEATSTGTLPTGPWLFNPGPGTWSVDGDDNLGSPSNNRLTSPEIAVTGTEPIRITVAHRYSFEAQWDGGAVFVSINDGPFEVVPGDAFTTNGYTYPAGLVGNHELTGQDAFNGNSPGYQDPAFVTSIAELPGLAIGDTIRVRFLGGWDEFARGEFLPNWEIDSVRVETLEDSDGDGMFDVWEDANGLDKTVDDAALDPDEDTVTNLVEFQRDTDPQDPDTDDDGLGDGVETGTGIFVDAGDTGTDPKSPDTDGDGLGDAVEDNSGDFAGPGAPGTDPTKRDTDGDDFGDDEEIFAGTDPTDASSRPLLPVVIGYWSFDDGISPTADVSPRGNDGTVNGGAVFVPGHSGMPGDLAIEFDGIDDSVTTGVPLLSDLAEFTVAGWIRFDATLPDRTGLFGQNDCMEFGMINASTMQHWTAGNGGALDVAFGPAPEWTHIVVTGNDVERIVFIDGALQGVGTASVPPPSSSFGFNIGGGGIYDATGNFFTGAIDDVAVWNRVLTDEQIEALAAGELTPIGPPRSAAPFVVTEVALDAGAGEVTLTWNSVPGETYAVDAGPDLESLVEIDDAIQSEGSSTSFTESGIPAGTRKRYYRVRKP